MKKLLMVALVLSLLFAFAVPASAAPADPQPIQGISGNGGAAGQVFYTDRVFDPTDILMNEKYGFPERRGYRTLTEYYSEMNYLAQEYPHLVKIHVIGASGTGIPMYAVEVSNNPGGLDGRPGAVHQATNHGGELPSAELCMNHLWFLVTQYGKDPQVTEFLNTSTGWFVPLTNPSGTSYSMTNSSHRRTRILNANGTQSSYVDMNRNWPYAWGSSVGSSTSTTSDNYRGEYPASSKEIQAMMSLYQNNQLITSLSGHTSGQMIIYAWGHRFNEDFPTFHPTKPYNDNNTREILQKLGRELSGFNFYADKWSESLYPATGELCDYAWGAMRTLHFTIEHCRAQAPAYMGTNQYRAVTNFSNSAGIQLDFLVVYNTTAALVNNGAGRPAQNVTGQIAYVDDPLLFTPGYGGPHRRMTVARVNALGDLTGKIFVSPQGADANVTRDIVLAAQAKGAIGCIFFSAGDNANRTNAYYATDHGHYSPSFGTTGTSLDIHIPVAGALIAHGRELYERAKANPTVTVTLQSAQKANSESIMEVFERNLGMFMRNFDAARVYASNIKGKITNGKGELIENATLELESLIEFIQQTAGAAGTQSNQRTSEILPLGTLQGVHKSTYKVAGGVYDWSVVPSVQPYNHEIDIPKAPYYITASASGAYSVVQDVMVDWYQVVVDDVDFALPPAITCDYDFTQGLNPKFAAEIPFTTYLLPAAGQSSVKGSPDGAVTAKVNGYDVQVVKLGDGEYKAVFNAFKDCAVKAVADVELVIDIDGANVLPHTAYTNTLQFGEPGDYIVSMKPSKTELFVGESLTVDIMLLGAISYTQFAAEIAYDTELLEYAGYTNLQGWAASVTKSAADKVAVRSVPGMNMVAGAPCSTDTIIVTLKFTVKNTFVGDNADAILAFATAIVSPAGGVTGTNVTPCDTISLEFTRVGDASFQQNLALYPNMYSKATGTTMPVFNYGTGNILEEVYVECPLDTDFDGQRDLIRVQIRRPAESALPGVRVPAIFENSPYRDGTLSIPDHSVTAFPLKANADTSNYTYENDIKSIKPRASEWPWSDAANAALSIPASHGAKPKTEGGRGVTISSVAGIGPGSFGNYMLARGYAIIAGSSIGNRYSDGYTSCGDIDETIAAMAVIQWLNGNARAYTNQNCTTEVDATQWSNGKVAMSGVSYNGTLPIAVACSGVDGLKAIIPVAAISSWYDYYRENGGVLAPGTYQGEDADVLAKYCNSRSTRSAGIPSNDRYYNNTPNIFGIGTRDQFNQLMTKMYIDQDRDTGDYNRFWDDRNYIATADQVKAGIIVQHGLADWNVKMKNFDQFYRAVKEKTDTPIKLVLHRGGHGGIYTHEPFFRNAHKWLDYYLYGIENNIVATMPEVSVISSQTGRYEEFDSWPVPGADYTRYYLAPDVNGAAGALSLAPPAAAEKTIVDSKADWNSNPKLTAAQLTTWESRIYNAGNLAAASTERLAFVSDITQNVRFSGTVKATLQVASNKPFGYMTAALVEIGTTATRTFSTTTSETIAAHYGVAAISITRPSGVTTSGSASSYRLVTLGHADVQNPNPSGKTYIESAATNYIPAYYYQTVATTPGQFYSYTFEFEPNDWEFRAGNKLAIMVYSIDYRYTPTPAEVPELTVRFGPGSYVEIPALGRFNTVTPAPVAEILELPLEEPELDGTVLLDVEEEIELDIEDVTVIDE